MKNYKSQLLKIAVPIIFSSLINQIQMLIDRIFLGRIDVLYMSAVGNVNTPFWTTMSFVFSLSVGASILISQAVGEGNQAKVKEYSASLLKYHNIIPVILFFFWMFCSPVVFKLMGVSENVMDLCVTYTRFSAPIFLIVGLESSFTVILQTSNYTKHLVSFGFIRSILNIILDYLLIFGNFGCPKMGIAGAALATTLAEYGGVIFGTVVFLKSKKITTRPDFKALKEARLSSYFVGAKLGINTAFEDFMWNLGNLGIVRILNTINEYAAGIYSIVFSVEILAVVIVGALGNGAMTLSGEATGARDEPLFKRIVWTTYLWAAFVSIGTVVISILFPKQILGIFTTDPAVINSSAIFLILIAFNLFGKSGNIVIGSGIRGYGDTKWMFCTQIFGTVFVLALAVLFVLVLKVGMVGVYIAVLLDEGVRAVINAIRFARIKFSSLPPVKQVA